MLTNETITDDEALLDSITNARLADINVAIIDHQENAVAILTLEEFLRLVMSQDMWFSTSSDFGDIEFQLRVYNNEFPLDENETRIERPNDCSNGE